MKLFPWLEFKDNGYTYRVHCTEIVFFVFALIHIYSVAKTAGCFYCRYAISQPAFLDNPVIHTAFCAIFFMIYHKIAKNVFRAKI